MRPGRFLTAGVLYLGGLAFAHAILGYVLDPGSELRWSLVMVAVGIGPTTVGLSRLRNPRQEERPDDYGWWVYPLALLLVGYTAWLGYVVWLSVGAPS